MSVRPETLETPERGLVLENRAPVSRLKKGGLDEEIMSLRDQLHEIKERAIDARLLPLPEGGHCLDCFRKGLRAAAEHIEGKG